MSLPKKVEDTKGHTRTRRYKRNQKKIERCIINYSTWGLPTVAEIAKATGLSRQSVYNHLSDEVFAEVEHESMLLFRQGIGAILGRVLELANEYDFKAMKLYFEILKSYEKKQQQPKARINNKITINDMTININDLTEEQRAVFGELVSDINIEPSS